MARDIRLDENVLRSDNPTDGRSLNQFLSDIRAVASEATPEFRIAAGDIVARLDASGVNLSEFLMKWLDDLYDTQLAPREDPRVPGTETFALVVLLDAAVTAGLVKFCYVT